MSKKTSLRIYDGQFFFFLFNVDILATLKNNYLQNAVKDYH